MHFIRLSVPKAFRGVFRGGRKSLPETVSLGGGRNAWRVMSKRILQKPHLASQCHCPLEMLVGCFQLASFPDLYRLFQSYG
jgi:hypothetical protein